MPLAKTQHIFVCTCVLCAMLFLMLPTTTTAQTVNIPDANLRTAVAGVLGKPQDARITRDEIARLTHLAAHNTGIRDLTGLEFATGLKEIRCNNNAIADLSPLAGLAKLGVVELRHNQIRDLSPLKGLINLTWIIVPYNQISDVSPLRGLINLKGLDIGGNVIPFLRDYIALATLIKYENPVSFAIAA